MISSVRRPSNQGEETPLTMTRNRHATRRDTSHGWQPTPAGSLLLAWGGRRDRDGILQARLYRTWDDRFLVYEQHHDATAVPKVAARVTCREIEQDAARALYVNLAVHTLPEEAAFGA